MQSADCAECKAHVFSVLFFRVVVVAKKGDCPDEILEKISSLKAHSSIAVIGKIKASEKAAELAASK